MIKDSYKLYVRLIDEKTMKEVYATFDSNHRDIAMFQGTAIETMSNILNDIEDDPDIIVQDYNSIEF